MYVSSVANTIYIHYLHKHYLQTLFYIQYLHKYYLYRRYILMVRGA